MKNFNSIFNQLTAMPKRLAMVLTVLFTLGVGNMWGETETISFSSYSESGSGNTYALTWNGNTSCTIKQEKGSSTSNVSSSYKTTPRWYASHLITFTPKAGCTITKVVLTASGSGNNGQTMTFNSGEGTITNTSNTVTTITGSWTSAFQLKMGSQWRAGTVVVTYTPAASCDKEVKVVKGTPSNGSFNISKDGTYKTCDEALVITLSNIKANDGYQVGQITQTGINSGVTIDQENKTVTYAQNTSGTSTINVTFTALETHSVTWMVNGTEYNAGSPTTQVYDGGQVTTLPTAPDPAKYCGQVFAGWTKSPIDGEIDTEPSVLFTTAANSPAITDDITFYAVFADYAN